MSANRFCPKHFTILVYIILLSPHSSFEALLVIPLAFQRHHGMSVVWSVSCELESWLLCLNHVTLGKLPNLCHFGVLIRKMEIIIVPTSGGL